MQKYGGDFSATGDRISVPASPDTFNPGKVSLVNRIVPAGAKCVIQYYTATVVDVGNADQVYFAILRNGLPVQAGFDRIPGVQFEHQSQIAINLTLLPGFIEIMAFNISGMLTSIEPAAAAAIAIKCQAFWIGSLLSERGGIS